MTGTVRSPPSPAPRLPLARLRFALAASALAHGALLLSPRWDFPGQGWFSFPAAAPMMVRIEPLQVHVPEAAENWDQVWFAASAGQAPGEKIGPGSILPDGDVSPNDAQAAPDATALPLAPDPRYYPALDLDTYPWPLAPLHLDKLEGARAGEVRLEMLVDETGVVRDVVFVLPARPGPIEEALRDLLAATPFAPGRKDGRAVRSRIVLSVGFPTASER